MHVSLEGGYGRTRADGEGQKQVVEVVVSIGNGDVNRHVMHAVDKRPDSVDKYVRQQQQQTFKVWQPPRAARSNRPNTPSDGSKTRRVMDASSAFGMIAHALVTGSFQLVMRDKTKVIAILSCDSNIKCEKKKVVSV